MVQEEVATVVAQEEVTKVTEVKQIFQCEAKMKVMQSVYLAPVKRQ